MRPVKPCPSKAYLMTLPCATLALYWKTALEGQLAQLVQADGEDAAGSALGKALRKEVASAEKFARLAPRADREVRRAPACNAPLFVLTVFRVRRRRARWRSTRPC